MSGLMVYPVNDKIYKYKIWLEEGKLKVRGYLGFLFPSPPNLAANEINIFVFENNMRLSGLRQGGENEVILWDLVYPQYHRLHAININFHRSNLIKLNFILE